MSSLDALLAAQPAVVVEAAGHAAVAEFVPAVLEAGVPVVLASIGALAEESLHTRLVAAARKGGTRLLLPSGAIGGIDYLEAARRAGSLRVCYRSRKPPAAWSKELAERGIRLDGLNSELMLFKGSAREAALLFPKNLNVAVTLALAGVGIDATEVEVVADPRVDANTHEIEIESNAGRSRMVFENTPSAINPKTSALAALSIVRMVEADLLASA